MNLDPNSKLYLLSAQTRLEIPFKSFQKVKSFNWLNDGLNHLNVLNDLNPDLPHRPQLQSLSPTMIENRP